MSQINLRLKQLRQVRNLSQAELAQKLGISRQAIIALEQGSSLPSLPVIMALLQVLDVPFHELLGETWSPFRSLDTEPQEDAGTQLAHLRHADAGSHIPVTLTEDDKQFYLLAELAGVREEDVTIDLGTQHTLIMAIKKPALVNDTHRPHIQEVQFGPFMRILSLPCPIDTEKSRADFRRGVLALTLPKLVPTTERRITFHQSKEEDYGSE